MASVVFIDSSVLLCLIDVPGKNEARREVEEEFNSLLHDALMILPLASIIETGNHIAQLPDGASRRRCAKVLEGFLLMSVNATPPWVVGEARWDRSLIEDLATGVPSTALSSISDLAANLGVGAGDASIVHEARRYKSSTDVPSAQPIRIWTLDQALNSVAVTAL